MKTLRSKKGFTLIELLLVVALISVLVGTIVYFVNPTATIEKAARATCKQIGKTLIGSMTAAKFEAPAAVRQVLLDQAKADSDLDVGRYAVTFVGEKLRVVDAVNVVTEELKLPKALRQ